MESRILFIVKIILGILPTIMHFKPISPRKRDVPLHLDNKILYQNPLDQNLSLNEAKSKIFRL